MDGCVGENPVSEEKLEGNVWVFQPLAGVNLHMMYHLLFATHFPSYEKEERAMAKNMSTKNNNSDIIGWYFHVCLLIGQHDAATTQNML